MSTIKLTFNTPNPAPYPFNYGKVTVSFNDGTSNISLPLNVSSNKSNAGYFVYPGNQSGDAERTATNFAASFYRDYKNIGGTSNISVSVTGKVATITASEGTFNSGSYNGNMITVSSVITNVEPIPSLAAIVNYNGTGDCLNLDFDAVAADGVPPYRITYNGATVISNWDGSNYLVPLKRGTVAKVTVWDSADQKKEFTHTVARKLAEGDFSVSSTGYEVSSDLLINRDIVIAFTEPLEYSLDPITEETGTNYQSTNSFVGVLNGQYRVFIKDRYGCEIYKTINVDTAQDGVSADDVKYFQVMEGQSIIFNEFVEFDSQTKKNYFNTGSYNEAVQGQRYNMRHYFSNDDKYKGIQFKSSYPFHTITLHHKDGRKVDIPPIMISENLGVLEKMDVYRFPLESDSTKTGVYFNGGNTYVPDTETVLGTNEYVGFTPSWAKVGQIVYLDGFGLRIESTGYDASYGWYFVVNAETSVETAATVQLTHNKQVYNTFEFYLNTALIEPCDVIIIEKGYESDVFDGNPWVSERLYPLEDNDEYLLIRWSDVKNKSDIVFQSGIEMMTRLQGEFIPDSDDSAETYSGDSNEYSIEQIRRLNFQVLIEGISFKQATQLSIASALSGFTVNGLNLVSKSAPEKKRMDKSNLWSWSGKFAFGKNQVAVQQDEIVLSVGTGVIGGGSTGKTGSTDISDVTLFKDQSGNLIVYRNGTLIKE